MRNNSDSYMPQIAPFIDPNTLYLNIENQSNQNSYYYFYYQINDPIIPVEFTPFFYPNCENRLTEFNEKLASERPILQVEIQNSVRNLNLYKYVKKNAESNSVNQLFSYMSTPSKSRKIVSKILNSEKKASLYYQIMGNLKKINKKYINRCYIKRMCQTGIQHKISQILRKMNCENVIGLFELQKTFRILIRDYFRSTFLLTIMTSSKLDGGSKKELIERGREIYSYLKYHLQIGRCS